MEGWQGTVEPLRLLGHSAVDFCFMATHISIFKIDRARSLYSVLAKSKMVTFSHDAPLCSPGNLTVLPAVLS